MITKYIGQIAAVATLNEELSARANAVKNGEKYVNRPIFFGGWTGTGKSNLARAFTDQLEHQGYNYYEVPQNSGWTELAKMAEKIASFDEETNAVSSIPYVIFWDEMHSQKIGLDLMKALTTKVDQAHTISRNGRLYHYDPCNHIHIFASNRKIDDAMRRRCKNLETTTYTKSEMTRLAELMITKKHGIEMTDEAVETIIGRVKPLAGDLEELAHSIATRAKAIDTKKIDGGIALDVARKQGYFPLGLRRADVAIVNRLAEGVATSAVLKFKSADEKKKDTQERIDWLCAIGLSSPVRGGFSLTKAGLKYVENIAELQKAARAAKGAKHEDVSAK